MMKPDHMDRCTLVALVLFQIFFSSRHLSKASSSGVWAGVYRPDPWQCSQPTQNGDPGGSIQPPDPSHSGQTSLSSFSVNDPIDDSHILKVECSRLADLDKAETVVPLVMLHIVRRQVAKATQRPRR